MPAPPTGRNTPINLGTPALGTPRPGSPLIAGKKEPPLLNMTGMGVHEDGSALLRPEQPLPIRSKVQIDPSA